MKSLMLFIGTMVYAALGFGFSSIAYLKLINVIGLLAIGVYIPYFLGYAFLAWVWEKTPKTKKSFEAKQSLEEKK